MTNSVVVSSHYFRIRCSITGDSSSLSTEPEGLQDFFSLELGSNHWPCARQYRLFIAPKKPEEYETKLSDEDVPSALLRLRSENKDWKSLGPCYY